MTVLNEMDRFHLVQDALDRLPQLRDRGAYLKERARRLLIEHATYIRRHGRDMPLVADWRWPAGPGRRA